MIFRNYLRKPAKAIEIADEEKRGKFVLVACGNDSGLKREVMRLLDAYARADQMLEDQPVGERLAGQLSDAFASSPHNPSVEPRHVDLHGHDPLIGPYRLVEKIGEGGFGEVFVALQSVPVRRRVAIKIIKPGMDSKEVVARFNAERQALAIMNHANIAKILEGGTTSRGLPYFVMELVPGVSITDYCDRTKLGLMERLQLFVETCGAIQHAHQKGIIHRDIKPTNILISTQDGQAVVKVIDFGVAKALNQQLTDDTIYIRATFMIGTPAYMSPEQAEMTRQDIDTRTDIYSLGAVLYELLTGSPPFEPERFKQNSLDEMRRIIREQDPPRPSSRICHTPQMWANMAQLHNLEPKKLRGIFRVDLDWIVMKALSKDRTRRYDSVSGLAADVQRYLSGEPVLARPPSWVYLSSRFVRRHRDFVAAVAFVLAFLVLGVISSVILTAWALRERSVARRNESIAFGQTRLAEDKSREANLANQRSKIAEDAAVRSLLDAKLSFIKLNIWSRRSGQQFESLRAIREAVDFASRTETLEHHLVELRTQAISALTRVDVQLRQAISLSEHANQVCARSGDLSTIAFRIREEGRDFVTVRSIEAPEIVLQRVPIPFDTRSDYHDAVHLKLSLDASYLSIISVEHGTVVWDLKANRQALVVRSAAWPFGIDFSPDMSKTAVLGLNRGDSQSVVQIYDIQGARLLHTIREDGAFASVGYSPDGRHLAVATVHGVSLFETTTWKAVARFPMPRWGNDHCIAWSRNGELLAVGYGNEIWIWQVEQGLKKFFEMDPQNPDRLAHSSPNEADDLKPIAIAKLCLMAAYEPDSISDKTAWQRQLDTWSMRFGSVARADSNRPAGSHFVVESEQFCLAAIGIAWLAMGEEEKALQMINSSSNHRCEAWFALAAIHAKQGKFAEAKKELESGRQRREGYSGGDLKIVDQLQQLAEQAIKKSM